MKGSARIFGLLLAVLAVVGVAIQFIPVQQTNPAVIVDITAPDQVKSILRRSCYNCHSNETEWPWYSRIAPVSWLIAHDVSEGREKINFSNWSAYSSRKQAKLIRKVWREVKKGEMPTLYYLPVHPEAVLNEDHKRILHAWASKYKKHKKSHFHRGHRHKENKIIWHSGKTSGSKTTSRRQNTVSGSSSSTP